MLHILSHDALALADNECPACGNDVDACPCAADAQLALEATAYEPSCSGSGWDEEWAESLVDIRRRVLADMLGEAQERAIEALNGAVGESGEVVDALFKASAALRRR